MTAPQVKREQAIRSAMARKQQRRNSTETFALDVVCPACEADAGSQCHVNGNPRLTLDTPHPKRVDSAAKERTIAAMRVVCPTCGSQPNVACRNRTDPHPLRWARGRKRPTPKS